MRLTKILEGSGITLGIKTEEKPSQAVVHTENNHWIVYLIETDAGLYCGITTDMTRRYQQHCNGTGAKFFRRAKPVRIVYTETQPDRSTASKREYAIKQLRRDQKLALIATKSTN